MIEKGFQPYTLRNEGWMGHYNLVVGYDDEKQILTVQDSYLMSYPPWGGEIPQNLWDSFIGFDFSYSELEQAWRSFNFVFIVVYQPERENDVLKALGPLATDEEAYRIAYERAMQETSSLTDVRDKFFAWFNAGTSLVGLQDYFAAATAFDTAFGIYPDIDVNSRPYRMLWYATDPYAAYYYSTRYQDVINLADQTLGTHGRTGPGGKLLLAGIILLCAWQHNSRRSRSAHQPDLPPRFRSQRSHARTARKEAINTAILIGGEGSTSPA
jgi:tetratricopeptide (TPR) repeat protein